MTAPTPEDRAYEILGTRCYCPSCRGGTCHYCLIVAGIEAAVLAEREWCLAIVQHAREEGETDMRQVRDWIKHPEWKIL